MREVHTDAAPKVVGPYSQAIIAGNLAFCSGQIGIDPASGELVQGGVAAQTKRVLQNLEAVLKESGAGMDTVVSTTVYLVDMNAYAEVNEVYAAAFSTDTKPARTAIAVAALPKGALVEISCIASLAV